MHLCYFPLERYDNDIDWLWKRLKYRENARKRLIAVCMKHTVPLKGKLPPLISFLARRASFLMRRFSFLSRITDAFSMAYNTRKKPDMCNGCCSAVRWQIDGTVQCKMCIGFISLCEISWIEARNVFEYRE